MLTVMMKTTQLNLLVSEKVCIFALNETLMFMNNTTEIRSKNMAAIKGKDTKPEIIVRKFLWANGFRYRLNHPRLPGKPDVVLLRYRTCIFINGCFWHGHDLHIIQKDNIDIENSDCCKIPHTNRSFWIKKLLRNKERDIEVQKRLAEMGWHCITIWECELKPRLRTQTLERLAFTLNSIYLKDHSVHGMTYQLPEDNDIGMVAESDNT